MLTFLDIFLLKCYEISSKQITKAWSAIKSCCDEIFSNEEQKFKKTLFTFLPEWVVQELNKMPISNEKKLERIAVIFSYLPEEDRLKIEKRIIELNPSFMNLR